MPFTINPTQSTRPQSQNPMLPTAAETGTNAFQKVLEKQLSHQEVNHRQNETSKSAGVKKANQSKSSTADAQPEKPLAAKGDVLKSARDDHTKTGLNEKTAAAKNAESEARLNAELSIPDSFLSLQNAIPMIVEVNVGAQALTLSDETDGSETQPTALSTVDNPMLPLLNLVNITSTIQSKLDQSQMMTDKGALEKDAFSAGNVGLESVKSMGENIDVGADEKLDDERLAGVLNSSDDIGVADKQIALSQDFPEILKRSADSQDDLALKSIQKTNTAALPVNSHVAIPVLATPINSALAVSNLVTAPLGTSAWNEAIGQKIIWMVGGEQQSATLTLNPPDLGPLQVVIQVRNDHADATFISQNPEVRQALEDGLDNLRNMMSNSGIELGQANVHAEQHSQQREQQKSSLVNNLQGSSDNALTTAGHTKGKAMVSNGLVDTFA